ncbi:PREDICTED: CAAX prenyl protease 2-like [Amphimedon queenslandica]|uniref:CAAX prenyl protease 2 n=1 Tax=Amphimedon queenslandica TaxID=400682 RepID=A0A1X7TV96_AMPQE|nr:PREDICTED: CAAX prenyl protease 2-like [Amphimedon queenslandica]|eukprot:XP_003389726.1 PREDICTED: CAAX prenyl protease 2-like [Amphimedon queenslandica]
MPAVSLSSLSLSSSLLACFGLAGSFVLSLYLADGGRSRDHPLTVKRRITAVTMVTIASPLLLYVLAGYPPLPTLLQLLGIKTEGLLRSVTIPFILIPLLYAGPILQTLTSEGLVNPLADERPDIILRNYVVAPLAEEVVFRGCMVPLLLPHLQSSWTIIIGPLFFGLAHIHHLIGRYLHEGEPLLLGIINALFQTTYTSLFGMFSSYLFIRTGHLVTPVLSHSLCNVLGLPNFIGLRQHKYRYLVSVAYVAGLAGFIYFLPKLTNPVYYN